MRIFAQKQNQSQKQVSSSVARPNIATSTLGDRKHPVLHLQSVLGNQAIQRMLRTNSEAIQTKLAVSRPGDEYEQEADRIADKVMNTPGALPSAAAISNPASIYPSSSIQPYRIEGNTLPETITPLIQRKPGDADKPNTKAPVKEEYNKAELEFHSVMGFPDILIVTPDDLKGSTFRIYPEEDRPFVIGWRVWNTGWKTAPYHHNRLTIYDAHDCYGCRRPEDLMYSKDSLAFETVPIIKPGKSEYEESFSVDGLPAGHYEAFGELDVNNEVDEINEDNNTQFMVLDVKPVNKPKSNTEVREETVQPKREAGAIPDVGLNVESQVSGLRGKGQPLPESVRDFFEPRFGYDFSQVQIHTDAGAAESAGKLQAKAFTVGRDVVFSQGQYAVEKPEGRHLLAHELTHVVQQTRPKPLNKLRPGPSSSSLLARKPSHGDNLD